MRIRTIPGIALVVSASFSIAAFAQSPAPAAAKSPALAMYERHGERMIAAAQLMPEEAYSARLAPGVRSFAEAIGHSIDTNFGVCAGARKLESPKKGINHEQSIAAKADLLPALKDAIAYCAPFVVEAVAAGTHTSDITFLNVHNGQMVVLMDAQLIARGLAPAKGSEAAAPEKK
jgi:hypothetical protein